MKSKIFLSFLLICLVIFFGFNYFYGKITIEVDPVFENKSVKENLNLGDEIKGQEFISNKELEFKKEGNFTAAGQKNKLDTYAKGKVMIFNDTQEEIRLQEGLELVCETGDNYLLVESVSIPAKEVDRMMDLEIKKEVGRAIAPIRAQNKGSSFNLTAGHNFEMINSGHSLLITNLEAIQGGTERAVTFVAKTDLDSAIQTLKEQALQQAEDEFSQLLANKVFNSELINLEYNLIEKSAQIGKEVEEFTVSLLFRADTIAVDGEKMDNFINKLYNENIGEDYQLLSDGNIEINDIKLVKDRDDIYLNLESSAQVIGNIKEDELIDLILGNNVNEVRENLEQLPQIKNYKITPDNQINLPNFKFGIDLIIKEPN